MVNVLAFEGQHIVEVVCDEPGKFHRRYGASVIALLRREERGDGRGHYWTMLPRMTAGELERWEQSNGLDLTAYPRGYRDPRQGFRYVRDGHLVTDPAEVKAIGAAMHHGTGPGRKGEPEPGILDGVHRHFEMRRCKCGEQGIRKPAAPVERGLEVLEASLASRVSLSGFRRVVDRIASNGL